MVWSADGEVVEGFGGDGSDVDVVDAGGGWAFEEFGEEVAEGRVGSFGDEFDAAVGTVADPAGDAELLCGAAGEVAEANALHAAGDVAMEGCLGGVFGHNVAQPEWIRAPGDALRAQWDSISSSSD